MTLNQASEIILKKNPLLTIRACMDYGDFFVFTLAPLYVKNSDYYVTGRIFPAVDKRTGKVFEYDITSDFDAFENAIKVV